MSGIRIKSTHNSKGTKLVITIDLDNITKSKISSFNIDTYEREGKTFKSISAELELTDAEEIHTQLCEDCMDFNGESVKPQRKSLRKKTPKSKNSVKTPTKTEKKEDTYESEDRKGECSVTLETPVIYTFEECEGVIEDVSEEIPEPVKPQFRTLQRKPLKSKPNRRGKSNGRKKPSPKSKKEEYLEAQILCYEIENNHTFKEEEYSELIEILKQEDTTSNNEEIEKIPIDEDTDDKISEEEIKKLLEDQRSNDPTYDIYRKYYDYEHGVFIRNNTPMELDDYLSLESDINKDTNNHLNLDSLINEDLYDKDYETDSSEEDK